MAGTISFLFYIFFALGWITQVVLHIFNIISQRLSVNQSLEVYQDFGLTVEEGKKALSYGQAKLKFQLIQIFYHFIIINVLLAMGYFVLLKFWFGLHGYWPNMFALALTWIILELVEFPGQIFYHFSLEKKYGFNKMSFALFLLDQLKTWLITGILVWALVSLLYLCMAIFGPWWWIVAFIAMSLFQILLLMIYPVWIAPLFNRFTPLAEGQLKQDLVALCQKLKFSFKDLYVMDGSKRSSHSNAYFTGFGANRRIVLFDTLLEQLNHEQIVAVLAHEIGHYQHKHIRKTLIFASISLLIGLAFCADWLSWGHFFYLINMGTVSFAIFLIFISVYIPYCFFPFKPINSFFSKKHEFQADAYSFKAMGSSKPLIEALKIMTKKNLSIVLPNRFYALYYYSHPPVLQRIQALKKLEQGSNEQSV